MAPPNILREKSYTFALGVVAYCRILYFKREYVLAKQLLKSGTSVGANIEEATQAQSRADFISKLSIAHKEAAEADYWLRLLIDSKIGTEAGVVLREKIVEISRMLTSSLKTLKGKN